MIGGYDLIAKMGKVCVIRYHCDLYSTYYVLCTVGLSLMLHFHLQPFTVCCSRLSLPHHTYPVVTTVEKTSTGVSPAELILNNSIRLTSAILSPPSISNSKSQISLSDVMDRWISKQTLLLKVAQKNQRVTDSHHLVVHDPRVTEFPLHS